MKNQLKVATVQADLIWEERATNLIRIEQLITPLANQVDLIVLPEMFSTGFTTNAKEMAEPMDGPTMTWLTKLSNKLDAVICGSLIIADNDRYFNRLIWMRPGGHYSKYDKRHLFTLAKEHETYTGGTTHLITELKGWKIMPLICYDLRFPVWSRNTMNYDLLLYVANFPERRRLAWQQLLIARAIENQAYTIGVNRMGMDGNGITYSGDSAVIDYEGKTIYEVAYQETVGITTLNYSQQVAFRSKFAFLNDRDFFVLDKKFY